MVPLLLESAPLKAGPSVSEFAPKGRLLLTATIAMVRDSRSNEHEFNCLVDNH